MMILNGHRWEHLLGLYREVDAISRKFNLAISLLSYLARMDAAHVIEGIQIEPSRLNTQ